MHGLLSLFVCLGGCFFDWLVVWLVDRLLSLCYS